MRRYQKVIDEHSQSKFVPEALHRLVETYYSLGMIEEAKKLPQCLAIIIQKVNGIAIVIIF